MHFAETPSESNTLIRSYQNGIIHTQTQEFTAPVVLFDNQAFFLLPEHVDKLQISHFQKLASFAPELILLGTGPTQIFPAPALLEPLYQKRIGFEVMTTDAACRTFNLLLAENRKVLAALFL